MPILNESYKYEPFPDEEFKQMSPVDGVSGLILPHYLLGGVSGEKEWENPDKARNTFVHLAAYEHFKNEEHLLLLGRTGSGKSAIINSLADDIRKGKVDKYSDVLQIDQKVFCEKLAELCNDVDINRFDATNKITRIIIMTIYTEVMMYCFQNFPAERAKLRDTIKYLLSKKLLRNNTKNLFKKIDDLDTEEIEKMVSNSKILSTGLSITKILLGSYHIINRNEESAIAENDYFEKALEEISNFLKENNKRILVLLDSFDEYQINNSAFVVAIRALILACFDIYKKSSNNFIYFKMAIASEIYTRVLVHLPAQNQTNTVAIIWSFKELIKCMALRFVSWYYDNDSKYRENIHLFNFLSKYKVSDLNDSKKGYEIAEEIFYNILPKVCKTNSSYTFLTLAFISRHTMKKPREIMQVFNAILDRIIYEKNNKYFFNENGDFKIKDVVHSLQNDFIQQNLSIYKTIFPNIVKYIDILLSGSKFIFYLSDKEFKNKLNEVNSIIQSDMPGNEYLYYFDKFDILKVVFESGLLGKVAKTRTVDVSNIEQFSIDKPIKIIDSLFEYQYKGKIQRNNDIQYVIHPMCYEHFNCIVGMRSMVNTDSYDVTELLNSVISTE